MAFLVAPDCDWPVFFFFFFFGKHVCVICLWKLHHVGVVWEKKKKRVEFRSWTRDRHQVMTTIIIHRPIQWVFDPGPGYALLRPLTHTRKFHGNENTTHSLLNSSSSEIDSEFRLNLKCWLAGSLFFLKITYKKLLHSWFERNALEIQIQKSTNTKWEKRPNGMYYAEQCSCGCLFFRIFRLKSTEKTHTHTLCAS